ncbi:MAG: hypothetical protein CMJ80_11565 [Planctomycetaceae bacterium]|nr:hypothetical protein [Planctomycetaceae bacterium]
MSFHGLLAMAAILITIASSQIARITAELERIGDHSMNIRESVSLLGEYSPTDLLPALLRMVNIVNGMVNDALNAFSQRDITKAQSTIANDNIVDALNDQIVGDLLHLDVVRKVKGGADMSLPLAQMLIARSLERIADQATNISEEVVYMVKGDDIRHQS